MADKIYYSGNSENDTTYVFERDPDGRGQITMTYTEDDPDFGTEELIYGGTGTEQELRDDLWEEMNECMDLQDAGEPIPEHLQYYNDEFSLHVLPIFSNMLLALQRGELK